ncbi:MAG: hypothetical protein KDC26_06225 [Armatimonadetes bacterium]|nr:hypothetical protein [Armatimonadota bacterium]
MKVLGYRFCMTLDEHAPMLDFFDKLGLKRKELPPEITDEFPGAIYPAGESWVEIWQAGEQMPAGTMLQIFVDDVHAFVTEGRANGLEMSDPSEMHGEMVSFTTAPNGMFVSVQSPN